MRCRGWPFLVLIPQSQGSSLAAYWSRTHGPGTFIRHGYGKQANTQTISQPQASSLPPFLSQGISPTRHAFWGQMLAHFILGMAPFACDEMRFPGTAAQTAPPALRSPCKPQMPVCTLLLIRGVPLPQIRWRGSCKLDSCCESFYFSD